MGGSHIFGDHVSRIIILDGFYVPRVFYVLRYSWMRPNDRHGMGGARTLWDGCHVGKITLMVKR